MAILHPQQCGYPDKSCARCEHDAQHVNDEETIATLTAERDALREVVQSADEAVRYTDTASVLLREAGYEGKAKALEDRVAAYIAATAALQAGKNQ